MHGSYHFADGMGKFMLGLPLLLVLFGSSSCLSYATLKDVQDVFNNIIQAKDHRHRPVADQSKPIVVHISLELVSLVDVDEVHQTLSTNVLLTLTWQDEFRTWTPAYYGGLTSVSPDPLDVWRPRLFVSNTVAERDMFKDDYAPLTVFYNGTTVWQPGGILHTSCPMRLARYPFDRHDCKLAFTTGESPEEIQFKPDNQNISLDFYETNGEWDLSATSIKVSVVKRLRENMPHLSFSFQLQRKVSFAILCILMPVIVISSLPALVFITPIDSGERVTFSITVFLSLTFSTEQMSGNFPKNSESLPLLVIYLACLLMYSSVAVCVNLVVLLKKTKNEHNVKATLEEESTSIESLDEFDRTKSFVSISDKYELDLPLTSRESSKHGRLENSMKIDHKQKKNLTTDMETDCSKHRMQRDGGRFGSLFRRHRENASNFENDQIKKNCKCVPVWKLPLVLKQMNQDDIVLFVVFSGIWLVLAVVFLILQVGDYGKN